MKTIALSFIAVLFAANSAQAGLCKSAYQEAKKLENIVAGVYFITETDDSWKGFASWEPVKKLTASEVRRVLKLGSTYEGDKSFFEMRGSSAVYEFLRSQVEAYSPEYYDDTVAQKKMKRLINLISKKYGKNVRLVKFGNGDGDSYFAGDHMIVLLDDNGCILGLKALTVWT